MFTEYCSDASPVFFGLLDFSIAPPLLYYAYIPIVLFSLWFAVRALWFNKGERTTQLFALTSLSLVLLSLTSLLAWIAAPAALVQFAWQAWGISSSLMFLSTFLFLFRLLYGVSLSKTMNIIFVSIFILIAALAPTAFNVNDFDITACEASYNPIALYGTYFYLLACFIGVLYLFVRALFGDTRMVLPRKKAMIIAGVAVAFLCAFLATSVWSEYLNQYIFELIAPVGAVLFLAGVSYVALEDKRFSIHMVGAEMLVVALIMVMLGIIFIQDIEYVHRVAYVSLALVVFLGLMLMKSVRSEVRQRLQIEELVVRLKEVNRILSHDVKGALGKHAMLFRALAEGEFGPVPDQAKGFIEQSAKDANKLIDSIMVILQSGHELSFHPTKFDMGNLVREVANESRVDAEKKGLQMSVTVVDTGSLEVNLDQAYIKLHVVKNLIANAINYTLQGNVEVKVDRTPAGKVLFSVKDSGVGIFPEDAPHMFTEGGHGKHSTEINVHSTGYGLYSAKRIVDACGGRIWFISAGIPGEGTTFFVELPTEISERKEENKNNP